MKKNFLLTVLTIAVLSAVVFTACAPAAPAEEAPVEEEAAPVEEEAAPAEEEEEEEAAPEVTEVALIIKATDSGFWQKAIEGGEAFAADNVNVNVTAYGPASESDIDEQISILENVITSEPDAIVIASNAGEGAVAAVTEAAEKGIVVMTIDVPIPTDAVTSHLATDNVLGGQLAAEALVEELTEAGIPLEGKVAVVSAILGVQVITERDGGFIEKMAELAPNIEVLEPLDTNNEIETALSVMEQIITREGDDLIGVYADNNHTGDGVGRAIQQAGLKDSVVVVAFDDDEEEINFLKEGVIDALIIQDPFSMGYLGCEYALKALAGEDVPSYIDTGVLVTRAEDLD